jgi:predicted nucleotidyltransferase
LLKYQAANPRLFGSVARGDAHHSSDIDLLVDLDMSAGNYLMRLAGLGEELSTLLGVNVDVVDAALLRQQVAATALSDAVVL